ncbi:MAG: endolytic transglycosylase MltG [Bacilli bacterium]|jgi:UPF0755 protein|nr:endolytic transglycosylase MltG [Bacilli bacterium]
MSKKNIILLVILILLGVSLLFVNISMSPVDKSDNTLRNFEVVKGATTNEVIDSLKKQKFIKNAEIAKLYAKIAHKTNMQAGVFQLKKSDNMITIIKHLNDPANITGVSLTFIDGKRVTDYAKVVEEKLGIKQKDFLAKCNDKKFIATLKEKYELVKDYKFNNKAYYLLEGLLAPDTYVVSADSSAETVIEMMVKQANSIYLQNKADIKKSKLSVHDIYTLASIVDLEANSYEDRRAVASVFINRLNDDMPLGSDVTTYYGLKINVGDRDLTTAELAEENGYNTRSGMLGLPVGPICNPSITSIRAVLNPKSGDNLYFVSDKNGKVYLAKTYEEHNKIIEDLKSKNLWFTYDN